MVEGYKIVENQYFDSVFLMRVAKRIGEVEGIEQAAAVMATEKNLNALAQAGYTVVDNLTATPNGLIVAVKADSPESASKVLDKIEDWLALEPTTSAAESVTNINEAVDLEPESNLAIISVPGEYAAAEARKALELGLNVFIFSDNVSLDDELDLKRSANDRHSDDDEASYLRMQKLSMAKNVNDPY
jgi:succinyl-CoA synthetase alpha subunit